MENGTAPTTNGAPITPEDFETMTDAADKPTKRAGKKQATGAATAAAVAPPPPPVEIDPIQAAREEIYLRRTVTDPLKPIFNRIPPEEIVFIIAYIEHAYRSGMAAAAAAAM